MSGSTEESVALTAALEGLARATARIRAGDDPVDGIVRDAVANLAPAAEAAARACLGHAIALREDASRATAAREVLLAGVAHDLRNPLNTLAMSAGLLREDIERDDVDPTRDLGLVKRMERGIDRMRRIVEDVLDASRIEARKVELVERPEIAAHIAKDAIAAAATAATERSASIVESGVDASARVVVDRGRAVQALGKGIAFVLRSCAEGGQVQVSVVRDDGHVVFLVTAPLPPGAAPRTEAQGGLALLIARGVAELHGGSLEVHVTDSKTTVTITLPAAI